MNEPDVSVVVICYEMARELPRTVRTLSPLMQRDIDPSQYEIIVVDNGSNTPPDVAHILSMGSNVSYCRFQTPTVSPVPAINFGLARARGRLVGVMIDGARMVSPRLLATAREAARVDSKPVIGTIAFHLGPEMQLHSVAKGYSQSEEDRLLATVDWQRDGYSLFSISCFAGSSAEGWFKLPAETNALFMTQTQWRELGGYDSGFRAPGGGLANLDVWARACARPDWNVIMLLGEATFHQVHGGVATNARGGSRWGEFHEEYLRLRGTDFRRPTRTPLFVGQLHPAALPSLRASICPNPPDFPGSPSGSAAA